MAGQSEGNACCSMVFGCFCLLPFCVCMMFFNETNYVREMATADLIQDAEQVLDCRARPWQSGRLVFVTNCEATQPDLAVDAPPVLQAFLPLGFEGASLQWTLEIMQLQRVCHTEETCWKSNDGSKQCTQQTRCHNEAGWHSQPIEPERNHGDLPDNIRDDSRTAPAHSIFLSAEKGSSEAAFWADEQLESRFPSRPVELRKSSNYARRESWQAQGAVGSLSPGMLRIGGDGVLQTGSGIGDIRITLSGTSVRHPSVAAMQVSDAGRAAFAEYPSQPFNFVGQTTKPLERLVDKRMTRREFIDEYKTENKEMVWLLRCLLLVGMIVAFKLVAQPLSVAADMLRVLDYCTCCLGTLLDNASQCIISTVSIILAVSCFSITFALAWCVANPESVMGAGAVVAGGICVMYCLSRSGKQSFGREAALRASLIAAQVDPPSQSFKATAGP